MEDTLVGAIENKQFSELKTNLEKVVAKKIVDKISAKKADVISSINNKISAE